MERKVRISDLAQQLNVDSAKIQEVLQILNVDVKNAMSTVDQETAEKVEKAVGRAGAKKPAAAAKETAKTPKAAEPPKPVREANQAKASLLEDFFGTGARTPAGPEQPKRELRGERPLQERRPLMDRSRSAADERTVRVERPLRAPGAQASRSATERPLIDRPVSERQAAPTAERTVPAERPAPAERALPAERPAPAPAERAPRAAAPAAEVVVERPARPVAEPPTAPVAERPARTERATTPVAEPVVAEVAHVPQPEPKRAAPPEQSAGAKVEAARPEPVIAEVAQAAAETVEHDQEPAMAPETDLPVSAGPSRPLPAGPAAARTGGPGLPRPAAAAGPSGMGLPSRPVPAGPAAAPSGLGAPRPAGVAGPGAGAIASNLGMPVKPAPGAERAPRPGMGGPRPAGPGGLGAPRPGGFGPRPAGAGGLGAPRQGGGGFGPRRGGQLNIPKVDPKVAEAAKPAENKPRIGQGGDRKKGDAFTKRETAASRPSEEKLFGRRPGARSSIVERRSLKPITIEGTMTVKDLAHEMGVTASEVIKKLLTGFGIMATINQELDTDTCVLVGGEFGVEVSVNVKENVAEEYEKVTDVAEAEELKESRHPVVTIMGHVDHGKTSLLDAIRSAKVAAGEAGGITQHIGAYEIELNGRKITFLDTPGHEAFTAMRARGANVTDIAVLVVAADDSVMPQTIESINHAKAANVPILVAVNKIDKPQANPDRVKQDLTAHGLIAEEWGGETIMVPVSAKQGTNLDLLLENILILAEVQDLKANPNKEARGTILEAELDKARGPVATVLVQAGTLNNGDTFVAGTAWGRVRAMFDHRGRKLKSAGPSTPVRILGFNSVPAAGDVFRVSPDEKTAREVAEKRQAAVQAERIGTKAMSLDDFMSKVAEGEVKDLNLIIKGDVQGSVEALRGQLEKLRNEEVQVKIVHSGVGAITETDVMLASASKAIIIGFSVRPDDRATRAAADQGIDLRLYDVIYNVVDDVKAAMTGMLAPKIEENILGRAEVREIFKVPKVGMAAGCRVVSGKVTRNAQYRLIRDGIVVWTGEINQLRRFKDEAREVAEGYECGITLEKFQDFKPGDILEAFELKEVKAV